METNHLLIFRSLVETGHLRKTADLLGISHSGIAKVVRSLEDELGVKLTTRDGRNIRISPDGMEVYRRSETALAALEDLRSGVRKTNEERSRKVVLGTYELFSTHLLPRFATAFDKDTKLFLRELTPGEIEDALLDRVIDFGITHIPIPRNDLDHWVVSEIEMAVFVSDQWKDRAPIEEVPFVVPVTSVGISPNRFQSLDGWPEDRLRRSIRYEVSLMESALALVRAGLAAAYLPRFVAQLNNELAPEKRLKELRSAQRFSGSNKVFLVKRTDDDESPAMKKAARVLRGLN